jgi:hypothetical protein
MENQQFLDSLISKLKSYKGKEKNYAWKFDTNIAYLTEDEKTIIENEQTEFAKVMQLRAIIAKKFSGCYDNFDLDFWIINKWGGIRAFKDNQKNENKILNFKSCLNNGSLTKDLFKTISSLSKISSFVEPTKYVIYDARVTYALNWLLLTTKNDLLKTGNDLSNIRFFQMPKGRNTKINAYDMNKIIHLNSHNCQFYTKEEAYLEFCKLICLLSKEVYGDDEYPCILEMLLFTISIEEIVNEIKDAHINLD